MQNSITLSELDIDAFRTALRREKFDKNENKFFEFLEKPHLRDHITECIKYGVNFYMVSPKQYL